MLQLLKPTSGEIHFDDEADRARPGGPAPDARRCRSSSRTTYASLDPRMTVGDIVSEPLVVHGIGGRRDRGDRVRYLLDVVGFNPTFTNHIRTSSPAGSGSASASRALALNPS